MTFFALTALTNTITSFFLGLLVLRKKTPAHMGKDFARFCVTATLWSLAYFIWQHAATPASALFWCQLLTCFSSFLPLTQLIFICNLLNIKHHPLFTVFLYGFSCLTAVLSFTPLMIAGVRPMAVFPFWPHAGSLYGGYLLIWMALIVYGQVLLITRYRTAPPPLKTLLYYLIIATLVGYLGGATNYPLWFGLPILPYGNIGVTFYVIIFAYAIARQRVLNIRIVRTEALVFLIFAILLIDALAVTSVAQAVVRGVLLGLFALVAFKFVRSLLDLDAANRQLEQDKRTLIEADRLKDEFLMMATHELTTPITAITGKLSMAIDENMAQLTDAQKTFFQPVYDAALRLNHLSHELMSVLRIDDQSFEIAKAPANLDAMIRDLVRRVKEQAYTKGNLVLYQPAPPVGTMELDEQQIREVLANVLDNAIRFTENGRIIIKTTLEQEKNAVIVSVADTGSGIDAAAQQRLFTRFAQSGRFDPNHPQEQQGAGLGLYIAKHVIALHGGQIWVASTKGHGTTVSFSLPMTKTPPEQRERDGRGTGDLPQRLPGEADASPRAGTASMDTEERSRYPRTN